LLNYQYGGTAVTTYISVNIIESRILLNIHEQDRIYAPLNRINQFHLK